MTRYGFRLPDDEAAAMVDGDLTAMVGRTGILDLFGRDRPVRVTAARRVDDEMLGPDVWVEAVELAERTFTVRAARITKLDADGNPVGESIDLGGTLPPEEGEWAWP